MATIHSHFRFFTRAFSFSTTFNLLGVVCGRGRNPTLSR